MNNIKTLKMMYVPKYLYKVYKKYKFKVFKNTFIIKLDWVGNLI